MSAVTVPAKDLGLILDNIGLPANNYNLAFSDGSAVGLNDGQILISLKDGHRPTAVYQKQLREVLRTDFPNAIFYFQPADIITQILDFGTPAAIDIQVSGRDKNLLKTAQDIVGRVRGIRGVVDTHLQQVVDAPEFFVNVDRIRALELGLTEQQIASSLNVSLSGSVQVAPNFWTDPQTGIPYQVAVQTPEYRNNSLADIETTPLLQASTGGSTGPNLLSNVAKITRDGTQTVANHENTQPTFDIYANLQDRDLGSAESDIRKITDEIGKKLPPGNRITLRGQIASKNAAFTRIELGLGFALVFVFLLMVVNFQSWGEPLVIILALPVAFAGIVASLFITQTSFSIPSLFGAIMSIGVASANSILLVTFAKEHRETTGCDAVEAAIEAGTTRLRPVLMTAGAMFVGLIPMAIGIGSGSEQNAALARAVLGGVAVGTCSTLLFVPFLYTVLRTNAPTRELEDYA